MANPFDQFDEQPQQQATSNPFDQFDAPTNAPAVAPTDPLRSLKLSARQIAEGALDAAMLPADAIIMMGRQKFGRHAYQGPTGAEIVSRLFDQSGAPKAETSFERVMGTVNNLAGGALVPLPKGAPAVAPRSAPAAPPNWGVFAPETPSNYAPPLDPRLATLQRGQAEGYVVPPTTTNPTFATRFLEGFAGKQTTAQLASAKNQEITNQLAARALGLNPDLPLTPASLKSVRDAAGEQYAAIRGAGRVTADDQFAADLSKIGKSEASKDFPEVVAREIDTELQSLRSSYDPITNTSQRTFDVGAGIAKIRDLREKADDAFARGTGQVGRAYRQMAVALENAIERALSGQGPTKLLADFKKAREQFAKEADVRDAFNQSTGNVDAQALAKKLSNEEPLTGDLRTIAEFGQAFPKATREFNESLPGISPWDFGFSGLGFGLGQSADTPYAALALAYPFLRMGTRQGLLTDAGQRLATPSLGPVRPIPQSAIPAGLGALNQPWWLGQ